MPARFLLLALICAWAGTAASAQASGGFDATSIKPYRPTGSIGQACSQRMDPKSLTLIGCTLQQLVVEAYDLKEYALENHAGRWVETDSYTLDASMSSATPQAGMMAALQAALAARFHLVLAHHAKPVAGYELESVAGGAKPQPATATAHCGELVMRPNLARADCVTIADIRDTLQDFILHRPVQDQTGISAAQQFRLELHYAAGTADQSSAPSIFSALPDQMGLKLRAARVPIEVTVIESARKPTAN